MMQCVRHTAVLALLTALAAAPAAPQFKPKMPKIGPIGGNAQATASQTTPRTPAFNERVIEINDARIDGLLAGHDAELAALDAAEKKQGSVRAAYEEENRKHPARLKEYEAKHKTWQQCQDTRVEPAEAKAKKDDMQAAAAECGVEPVRPEPPTPPSYPDLKLDEAGATAAKMTPEQYAIMKERVRYAVREEGKVEVTSSMWAFSGAELAAMEKRGPELYKAGQALQDRGY